MVAGPGTTAEPGRIHVAPGDGHMIVRREGARLVTGIAHHAVPSGCTPSVDPLFESLADAAGGRALGVILSGMGRDGAVGAARLVQAGGTIFAQDAATSAVWGMPRAVAEAGLATAVLPPDQIAARLAAITAVSDCARRVASKLSAVARTSSGASASPSSSSRRMRASAAQRRPAASAWP